MTTPRYEVRGNTFPAREAIKLNYFHWDPKRKVWSRTQGYYDVLGRDAAEAVVELQKVLETDFSGLDIEIVFINEEGKEAPL